ncbi:MAG: hypothetical protein JO006_15030 [Paucibacter sp.]|nr:hypothetical protein [Roseateles sp.]
MRSSRRLVAFVSGLLIYGGAVMLAVVLFDLGLVDTLALQLGGRTNGMMAATGIVSAINFCLAMGWAYSVIRVPPGSRRPLTPWCLSGVGVAWLIGALGGVFYLALYRADKALHVADVLLSPNTPPFWGPANILTVILAVLLAGVWALRKAPPRRRPAMA